MLIHVHRTIHPSDNFNKHVYLSGARALVVTCGLQEHVRGALMRAFETHACVEDAYVVVD